MKNKICTKCKIEKPLSEFTKFSISNDGLRYRCKECRKKYCKDNAEYLKFYRVKHYQENKKRIIERNKQYKNTHKQEYKNFHITSLVRFIEHLRKIVK